MATLPAVQGESAYEDSEWFRAYDFTGTKGFYLEGHPSCTLACHATFRATHFDPPFTATGTGLGVFVLPGATLPRGAWLGEYLGELLPLTAPEADSSDYAFTLPGEGGGAAAEVVIDAGTHGNWTRFVNSSCRPN
ncbi:hypothetical protein C8A05DRAFT_39087, partial [Staphylotrichum tortipilum]